MKKLNNKGFAIATVLYGLLIVMILLMSLLMSTMSFGRSNSKKFVNEIIDELEEKYDTEGKCELTNDTLKIGDYAIEGYPIKVNCYLTSNGVKKTDITGSINYKWVLKARNGPEFNYPNNSNSLNGSETMSAESFKLTATINSTNVKYKGATAELKISLKKLSEEFSNNVQKKNDRRVQRISKDCDERTGICNEDWDFNTITKNETGLLYYNVGIGSYPFYIIDKSDEGGHIYLTLISAENIDNNTTWGDSTNLGPSSAESNLGQIIRFWSNVPSNSYNMDKYMKNQNFYTSCNIDLVCNKNSFEIGSRFSNVKARLLTVQEAKSLGCTNTRRTCPFYLYNNLSASVENGGTANSDNVSGGYWLMNAKSDTEDQAMAILSTGNIESKYISNGCNRRLFSCSNREAINGLRPVIKIKLTE